MSAHILLLSDIAALQSSLFHHFYHSHSFPEIDHFGQDDENHFHHLVDQFLPPALFVGDQHDNVESSVQERQNWSHAPPPPGRCLDGELLRGCIQNHSFLCHPSKWMVVFDLTHFALGQWYMTVV